MRRALAALRHARAEMRFARMTGTRLHANTSPARIEALDKRLLAGIERIREYT
jgi:hypothetical protein